MGASHVFGSRAFSMMVTLVAGRLCVGGRVGVAT